MQDLFSLYMQHCESNLNQANWILTEKTNEKMVFTNTLETLNNIETITIAYFLNKTMSKSVTQKSNRNIVAINVNHIKSDNYVFVTKIKNKLLCYDFAPMEDEVVIHYSFSIIDLATGRYLYSDTSVSRQDHIKIQDLLINEIKKTKRFRLLSTTGNIKFMKM